MNYFLRNFSRKRDSQKQRLFRLRYLLLVLAFFFIYQPAKSQSIQPGTVLINIGAGISKYDYYGGAGDPRFIGLGLSAEVGLFSIGENIGVISVGTTGGINSKNTRAFAPRGIFHLTAIPIKNLDIYGAIEPVLFTFNSYDGHFNNEKRYFNGVLGIRYSLSSHFGLFTEFGHSLNYAIIGGSFKL